MSTERIIFDARLIAEKDYWLRQLKTESWVSPCLSWPMLPSESPQTFRFSISEELNNKIRLLAGSSSFLTVTIFVSGLSLCFSRYLGQPNVAIATPSLHDAPGNLLPILVEVRPEMTVKELLLAVRSVLLAAYERQSYPFHYLMRDLGCVGPAESPFNVVLEMEGFHARSPEFASALRISLVPGDSELAVAVAGAQAAIGAEGLKYFVDFWLTTLGTMLDHPEVAVRDLELPVGQETIAPWSGIDIDPGEFVPMSVVVHQLAKRTPHRPAVIAGESVVSYAELDDCSSRIGRYLNKSGIGPESRVAILMQRSPELIAVILGILKAGAAFVPVDPREPSQRISYVLESSRAHLVITDRSLKDVLKGAALPVVDVEDCRQIEPWRGASAGEVLDRDTLAYVIYTSGSTGRPKGVMVTHAGLMNYLAWADSAYGKKRPCNSILHTSVAFDLTITSVFLPLLRGGAITIAPEEAGGLTATLREVRPPKVVKLTPAHCSLLAQELGLVSDGGTLDGDLVIGGEALASDLVRDLWKHFPGSTVFNEYGPTETVVGCCVEEVAPRSPMRSVAVAIGCSIPNMHMYLLDEHMRPVPVGASGEIYISGKGVARGYLGEPGLTAARFVPNPFSSIRGERLYRTGDFARHLPGGRFDFVGRNDDQVKIRGHRIELGEIAASLREHPAVASEAVLVRNDAGGGKSLVAFCVCHEPATAQDLKNFLASRLPEYMVPKSLHVLETLPLTSNGKVNRDALLEADRLSRDQEHTGAGPRNSTEHMLVGVWSDLLGRKDIRITDNFFDLGGHSLFAVLLVSRIQKQFHVTIPLRSVFEAPTVAGLASIVTEKLKDRELGEPEDVIVRRERRNGAEALTELSGANRLEARKLDMAAAKGKDTV